MRKQKTLYRQDFSEMKCPGCGEKHADDDGMVLACKAHPRVKLDVMYQSGKLIIECGACHKILARVAVAKRKET